MRVQKDIALHLNEFQTLCKEFGVSSLYAFGSSTTNKFTEQSDIDLLVEIDIPDAVERGEKLMSLWDKLELFFKRKVDLLTNNSIKNPYLRKSIDQTKVLLYDGKRDQVFV